MKKFKKAAGVILSLFCFTSIIHSQDNIEISLPKVDEIFPLDIVKELNKNNRIEVFKYDEEILSYELLPNTPMKEKIQNIWTEEEKPLLEVECLYRYEKKAEDKGNDKIRNIIQNISKLEGIEYYSNRKKKIQTLYEKCYSIDNLENRNKIMDTIDDSIQDKQIIILQEDNSFGEYCSRLEYFEKDYELGFVCTNLEEATIAFFRGAEPEKLKIVFLIENLEDEVILYVKIFCDFPKYIGMEKYMKDSLGARVDAIVKWFLNMYS